MIVYECNSCRITTKDQVKCSNKTKDVPKNWITLDLNFYNNNKPTESKVKLIQSDSLLLHFCSNVCFKSYFFWGEESKKK